MPDGREPSVVGNVNPAQRLPSNGSEAGLGVRLLGPIAISIDGRTVPIASKRVRALLGYLVLREGVEISRSLLAGLLWGERSESQARASLRQALSELKTALAGPMPQPIAAGKETISWKAGSAWIDAAVVAQASRSADEDVLRDATGLVHGELMEGLAVGEAGFDQWLQEERERFRLIACRMHQRLMERAEEAGRWEEALASGQKLLSLDPLLEHVHRALMRIYAAQGRHGSALAQYERCCRELSAQLGVRPDRETEELARTIRARRREGPAFAQDKAAIAPTPRPEESLPLPSRPSIAVLPFTSIDDDAGGGYFARGVADDIITELSRNKDLFVVARHSSFHVASLESDPAGIGRALGVRHLLAGSVRRAGERLRLSLHLIDCPTGREAWAERYDRELRDLFDVQLEVARVVTSTIAGRLTALAGEALAARAPENLAAYDHVLRAQQYLGGYTRADYTRAREHLEAAIRADPNYARPYGLLCLAGVYEWFWEMPKGGLEPSIGIGETALALDDQDAKAHLALAVAHLFSWRHDRAIRHIERAIGLNPNDDLAIVEHGRILCGAGRPADGLLRVREAMRLNPFHPNWYWNIEGLCLHHMGRYEEAIAAYDRIEMPQFWVEAYLAACHAMCGRDERAAYHRARLLAMRPGFTLAFFRRGLPGLHEQTFLDTFRRAGFGA